MSQKMKTKTPLTQSAINLADQTPYLSLEVYEEKDTKANVLDGKAVVVVDPATGLVLGVLNIGGLNGFVVGEGIHNNLLGEVLLETPTTFKTGTWTPAAGKKIRLMQFDISANVTGAGTIVMKDDVTTIRTWQCPVGQFVVSVTIPGNGQDMAAINNVLTVVVGTATATIQWNSCGVEM